ncbi:phage tail tape measure protein [Clostridium perfringens]|uniref:phage tail tape measure protein n=1 Tax=Clostridium perfringens TaxID=1502 RepID=UPI0018E4AEA4|nr:phage tail tape measure protein [Clostridium perfringens]MBI6006001.1 phage tail tape measure protein [Clostridium perfringens]
MSLNLSFGGKLNKDKVLQQLEKDIKSLSKNLGVELEKVSLKDVDKATSQIQKQINQLSKNINLNISKISLGNNGALQDIQKQINSALKGEKINLEVKSDLKSVSGDFEDILKKSKSLENEIQLLNGKMAKLSTVMDKKGNVKNTTLTYQYDEGRQAVEKYGWTVKEVEGELVRVFDLVDKKIVNNKSKLESANLSQEQFLTQLENRLNKIKTLSETQHLKNSNYDNSRDLNSIQNIQNKINEAKAKGNRLSQEEKNIMTQQLVELDAYIKKESSKSAEINRSARFLTSQLRSLESLKIRVDNRGGGDKTKQSQLSSELERQINSYKKLIEENKILGSVERQRIQKTTNDMKVQTNELVRYQSQMSNILGRMKDYFIGGSVITLSVGTLKEAFSTIQEVDTALTDFRKVTDLTKNEYSEFVDFANEKAKELSGSTSDFIQSTANFIQMGYRNVNEAKKLAEDSQIYMNVGELTQEQSTKSLITILKSFNLEASKSTEILDKTNQVANDFPITVAGLAGGMSRAGSVLKNASNDIDQSIALLTAANTSIQDPIRVSNGLKSIALNLEKVKMKAGKATPKLQDMMMTLTKGRVSLTDVNGEFKSTYQIIKDLGTVWNDGTLKANEKALILQEVAGKHQANVLASLLSNAKDLDKIYEDSKNSAGSAYLENQRFMDSINGRLNALKENAKGIFLDLSNTDFLKGIISGINSGVSALRGLIKEFGAIPSVISLASASMTTLNTQFRKMAIDKNLFGIGKIEELFISKQYGLNNKIKEQRELIKEIKLTKNAQLGLNKATLSYGVNLGKVKGSIIATKVELGLLRVAATAAQAAISFGVGLVVSFAIEKLVTFIDKLHTTREELKQLNADFFNSSKQANETISKAEEKYSKIKELQNQLANTKNEQEKIELQSQLNKLQSEMVTLLPQTKNGLDSQNNAIANNNALIEESIRLKKEEREESAKKIAQENSKHMDVFDKYFENKNNYQKMSSSNSTGLSKFQKLIFTVSGYEGAIKKADTKEVNKELQEQLATITSIKQAVADMKASNMSDIEIKAQFGGVDVFEKIREFDNSLQQTQTTADNTKPSLEGLTNPLDAIKESAISSADALDKLGSKFNKLTGNIGLVQSAMKEFQKTGTLSAKTVGSILNSGDTRVISLLRDKNKFMENSVSLEKTLREESNKTYQQAIANAENLKQRGINDLSSKEAIETQAMNHSVGLSNEETQAKINNHSSEVNAHANSEETKTSNAENGANDRKNTSDEETNHKGNNYTVDDKNHASLVNSKDKAAADGANSMQSTNDTMFDHFAQTYKIDNENWNKLQQAKLKAFHNLVSAMGTADPTKSLGDKIGDFQKDINKAKAEAIGIPNPYGWDIPDNIGSSGFDPIKPSSEAIQPNYSPEANGHGSGKGKGKGKKGDKVDIKDIEDKIDAYKSLQDAIDDVNNELEITKTLEENATEASDKLYYMNQELLLYKDKKKAVNDLCWAKKQEAKALEKELVKNGFEASKGDIANYKERLEAIKSNVNAMDNSNKAKEQAIKDYKELKEKADKYFALTSKEIPQLQKEWYALAKTIKEVSRNQVKLMGEAERDMTNVIENEIDKRRKALEEDLKKQEDDYDKREEEYNKREKLLEKETNKVKEELQKQRDEYNKKKDDDNFERNLKEKQNELNKINSQIDSVRRDDSSEGQSKLKELLTKKEEIEKDLNNIIRDRQKQKGNELFDEVSKKIDKNNQDATDKLNKEKEDFKKEKESFAKAKDDILKKFDEKYNKEVITELAKGMITKGFIEIEGHVVKLREALNDYYKKNGEVFADSSLKLQDQIDKLELTKKLYEDIASINNNLGVSNSNIRYNNGNNVVQALPSIASLMIPQGNKNANVSIKTDLHIGTINEGNLDDVKRLIDERDRSLVNKITSQLHVH